MWVLITRRGVITVSWSMGWGAHSAPAEKMIEYRPVPPRNILGCGGYSWVCLDNNRVNIEVGVGQTRPVVLRCSTLDFQR